MSSEEQVAARYQKLRDLLAAGKWFEADIETGLLMLQAAGREKEGCFSVEDIKIFPCEDLRTIDKLWVKYSNGRFGFSVQKRIWLEVGAKVNWETECRLADRIGWRCPEDGMYFENLTFDLAAPIGHLPGVVRCSMFVVFKGERFPVGGVGCYGREGGSWWATILTQRCENCNI